MQPEGFVETRLADPTPKYSMNGCWFVVAMLARLVVVMLLALALAGCFGGGDEGPAETSGDDADDASLGAVRQLDVNVTAMPCPPGYDNLHADDICLAYDEQIPGPTWVFQQGERVNITLHNRVAETLAQMGMDEAFARELAEARFSLHRHGIAQDACSDGVAQPVGTAVCDSTVGPGESITYTFDTVFPGSWHYHDHAHTFTADPAIGPLMGHQGVQRGLWGSFIVLPTGATTDHVFDLHLMDAGVNAGLGFSAAAQEGERFDLNVVGLGYLHRFYELSLDDPNGQRVGTVLVGPGVSRGITVTDARLGEYRWTATGLTTSSPYGVIPMAPESHRGTITVAEGDGAEAEAVTESERQPVARTAPMVADQVFVIPFNHVDAMARAEATGSMGLPLLEARVGEVLEFHIVNTDVVPHVFHLHGHSWPDPETGTIVDAVPLVVGRQDTHTFTVVAGLDEGHTGDWFYHCHVGYDGANAAMWGILRVHA